MGIAVKSGRWQVEPLWMTSVYRLTNRATISSLAVHDTYLLRAGTLEHPLLQASLRILHGAVDDLITNPYLVVPLVMSSDLDFYGHNAAGSPRCLWAVVEVQVGAPQLRKGVLQVVTANTSPVEAILAVRKRLQVAGRRFGEQAMGRNPCEQGRESACERAEGEHGWDKGS